MIRHRRALFASSPVVALPVAMIQPPFRAALMTLIGPPSLLTSRPFTARFAAIAMSTVAVRAQEEGRQAIRAETGPLHQYRFVRRHACPQAACWTPAPVRVSLDLSVWSHLPEGDDIGASTVGAVGALLSCRLPCPPYSVPMIGRTAPAAYDVASGTSLRKLRFQMIDDTPPSTG